MPVFDPKPANSKWSRYDVSPLLALDPRNAPPAPIPSAAASAGAFGSPAPSGGNPAGPAFSTGPVPNSPPGAFEATTNVIDNQMKGIKKNDEEGKPFFKLWQESSEEDREAVADKVEEGFKGQNVDMREQAEKIASSDPAAGELAAQFGYTGKTAGAFSGPEGKKPKWDRKAWGGFLMEAGLRILASNRDDAGGAIGEGVLGTMEAQRGRGMEDADRATAMADRGIAMEELERKRTRDAASDRRAENADQRAGSAESRADRQEDRLAESSKWDNRRIQAGLKDKTLEKIVAEDGTTYYVEKKEGMVRDEDGKAIKAMNPYTLSAAQLETNKRAQAQMRATEYRKIEDALADFVMNDPELEAIQEATGDERRKMIDALVDRRVSKYMSGGATTTGAESSGEVLDFNDWK